jgi:hypothetical protein
VRCYFMRDGHIAAVDLVPDTSDAAAIEQAQERFTRRQDKFTGFEVWDRARVVHRQPPPAPKYAVDSNSSTTGGHGEAA